jgi:hypothetical protein
VLVFQTGGLSEDKVRWALRAQLGTEVRVPQGPLHACMAAAGALLTSLFKEVFRADDKGNSHCRKLHVLFLPLTKDTQ